MLCHFPACCFLIQGSNWVWSVDGNDKLQPFGFYIHGAMDTFSRRLLWLHVYVSNKDPMVIAHYYYKCVKRDRGMFEYGITEDNAVPMMILCTKNHLCSFSLLYTIRPWSRSGHSSPVPNILAQKSHGWIWLSECPPQRTIAIQHCKYSQTH